MAQDPTHVRQRLIDAALQVYGEVGRGATTRAIAERAGVNEVSLFRHFGSKDALIGHALAACSSRALAISLPERPRRPRTELRAFCEAHLEGMIAVRGIIRQTLADFQDHPEAAAVSREVTTAMARELTTYADRLFAGGLVRRRANGRVAALMLMSALLADAITRDYLPEHYPEPPDRSVRGYVDVWLESIGFVPPAPPAAARRGRTTGELDQ